MDFGPVPEIKPDEPHVQSARTRPARRGMIAGHRGPAGSRGLVLPCCFIQETWFGFKRVIAIKLPGLPETIISLGSL